MNTAVVCLAISLLALAIVLLPRARPRAGPLDPAAATAIVDLSKSLVDSEATMLTNRLREQGNLLGTLARRRLRRRGAARPGGGRGGGARAPPSTTSATPTRLLVLGIVSNPRTPHVRGWIRGTYLQRLPPPEEALLRFVFGRRGLTPADLKAVRAERREHRDVELIDASDFGERGGIFSCIDKLFEWFPHAARVYPIKIGAAQTIELAVREAPRPAGPDAEEEADSAAAAAASVPLAEPLPLEAVPAAPREECGFSGIPDERSGGYWTDATPIPAAGKSVKIGDATKKDSKSATAEQFSKMLGLRN